MSGTGAEADPPTRPLPGRTIQVNGRHYEAASIGPMHVVCLRHIGDYRFVGQTWQRLLEVAARRGVSMASPQLGIVYDDPTSTPPDNLRYDACLVITEAELARLGGAASGSIDPGIRLERLDGCLTWRTLHVGSYADLAGAYAALAAGDTFAHAGLLGPAAHPPYYEFYRRRPPETPAPLQETEVLLPVAEVPPPVTGG